MMRVYLDNVAASGRILGDLNPPSEMTALEEIEHAHSTGVIKRVTSRESWREQERTKDVTKRGKLSAARAAVSVVATDHIVLGSGDIKRWPHLFGQIFRSHKCSLAKSAYAALSRLGRW
jgi:hypothetical protein